MKNNRLDFHNYLKEICGESAKYIYFQPPDNLKMNYPAIVYSRDNISNDFADNDIYLQNVTYKVIVIDTKAESEIVEKISKTIGFKFSSHYVSNNYNYDVFKITYKKY